ncbi:hypothetical protein ASG29_11185 [Sphingomonas sp. Leaf412]|uniref:TM2 domain-containing protein n=1 Tax=Sphingomonas sp. Leaf412 TaxID=1736370 RepID=UPI00070060AE|nr:TM2 domain-containing protein [Sphingomonas sp. Leaf412]KQT32359.1 hypothetical protein ASG29_11185 [Sphingomonas sp. Leaf412]
MRGQVLGVDARTGAGLVAGDDGHRYTFGPADWAQRGEPAVGQTVDFETDDRRALNIFPLPVAATAAAVPAPVAPAPRKGDRSRIVAALLAFFIGTLGIHRFYLGRNGSGVVMLLLSLSVFGLVVSGPWALIDTVRYLLMSDNEFDRRYPK